jgi:hypothetical protein
MELKWGHLSADAKMGGGLFDVYHLFTHFYLAPGQILKLPSPTYLCISFHAHQNEVERGQKLTLQLRDSFGDKFSDPLEREMVWNSISPGYPIIGSARIRLDNWQIPKPGQYYFHARIARKPVGKVGLTVLPTPSTSVRHPRGTKQGFSLDWGHITDHVEWHPDGVISLHAISDFYVLPKGLDFILFNGELIVLITGDPGAGPDHDVQYALVDSDERAVLEPLTRKVKGQQMYTESRWYYSDAVKLVDVPLEGGHDYTIRISVDGKLLPSSVEYWVLKADDYELETR